MAREVAMVRFKGAGTAVLRYADAEERGGKTPAWANQVGFVEHHGSGHLSMRGVFAGHYVDVDEADHVSQLGAGEGAVAAGLLGVLGGPPGIAVGLLVGGVFGAEIGSPSDTEPEPRELAALLREAVPRSASAIVLVAETSDVDDMLAALGERAEDVTRRTLTRDDEARLEAALSATPPAGR